MSAIRQFPGYISPNDIYSTLLQQSSASTVNREYFIDTSNNALNILDKEENQQPDYDFMSNFESLASLGRGLDWIYQDNLLEVPFSNTPFRRARSVESIDYTIDTVAYCLAAETVALCIRVVVELSGMGARSIWSEATGEILRNVFRIASKAEDIAYWTADTTLGALDFHPSITYDYPNIATPDLESRLLERLATYGQTASPEPRLLSQYCSLRGRSILRKRNLYTLQLEELVGVRESLLSSPPPALPQIPTVEPEIGQQESPTPAADDDAAEELDLPPSGRLSILDPTSRYFGVDSDDDSDDEDWENPNDFVLTPAPDSILGKLPTLSRHFLREVRDAIYHNRNPDVLSETHPSDTIRCNICLEDLDDDSDNPFLSLKNTASNSSPASDDTQTSDPAEDSNTAQDSNIPDNASTSDDTQTSDSAQDSNTPDTSSFSTSSGDPQDPYFPPKPAKPPRPDDPNAPVSLPTCRHWFHKPCIVPWLKINNSCPLCRSKVESAWSCEVRQVELIVLRVKFELRERTRYHMDLARARALQRWQEAEERNRVLRGE